MVLDKEAFLPAASKKSGKDWKIMEQATNQDFHKKMYSRFFVYILYSWADLYSFVFFLDLKTRYRSGPFRSGILCDSHSDKFVI